MSATPRTLVVGHGQLGRALATALGARAPGAAAVWTRRDVPAGDRAAGVRYVRGDAGAAGELSVDCEAVFLAVPDREVGAAAAALAGARVASGSRRGAADGPGAGPDGRQGQPWQGVAVFHAAGALGLEPLRPLAGLGAATAILHPLRAFPAAAGSGASLFDGAPFTLAGDERAVAVGARLVATLGGLLLPSRVADRATYHLAAVLASNYGRLLLEWSASRFEASGLDARDARTAAAALLANAAGAGGLAPPPAFTGPIRRGDAATVEAHLAAMTGAELGAYAALGLLLVEAIGTGEAAQPRGSSPARDAVAAALRRGLDRAVRESRAPSSGRPGPSRRAGRPA